MKKIVIGLIGLLSLTSCTVYVDEPVRVDVYSHHRVYNSPVYNPPYVNREYGPRYGAHRNPYQRRHFERCGYYCVR